MGKAASRPIQHLRGFAASREPNSKLSSLRPLRESLIFPFARTGLSSGAMTDLPTPDRPLRIGTRASPLARAQADLAADALIAAHGIAPAALEIVPMTATGDRIQDRALAEVGGKALWTRELDAALDTGAIDIAVHSLKDVETLRDPRFALAAMLPRADPRDRLVVREGLDAATIADLPRGARLGTSSPRRAAQVRRLRPDLETVLLRGNVATRLAKLAAGEADATLLAAAGLERLGMHDVGVVQGAALLLPAASQGAIGIECRSDDARMQALVAATDHAPTHAAVMAERAFLAALGGDCRSPVAAHARFLDDGALRLDGEIFSADGADHVAGHVRIDHGEAAATLARRLLAEAPESVRRLFTV
jgi:hydroxymethylbilane synthase